MSLRPVDVSEEDIIAPPDPGPVPDLSWLDVGALVIDDAYQRPLGRKNWQVIRRIAAAFDWSRFTPVMAAPLGDGRFALIDGQHRAHAAAMAGQPRVPAIVVPVPPEAQAAAFADINTQRTALTPFHVFKASLAAGEDWATQAERVVARAGCRLMTYNRTFRNRAPGEIFAIALIRDHVSAGRGDAVTLALSALRASHLSGEADLYSVRVIRPWLGVACGAHGHLPSDLLAFADQTDLISCCGDLDRIRVRPGCERASAYQLAMIAIRERLAAFAEDRAACPDQVTVLEGAAAPVAVKAKIPSGFRCARQVEPEPAPRPDHWPAARDAAVLKSGGSYSALADLSEMWGVPLRAVQARWHKLRAAA